MWSTTSWLNYFEEIHQLKGPGLNRLKLQISPPFLGPLLGSWIVKLSRFGGAV